jgi:thiol-disulfide isomerase/thioredoxin
MALALFAALAAVAAMPASVADLDYAAIANTMHNSLLPKPYGEMTPRERAEYAEEVGMELRSRVIAFLAEHPDDPRRWELVMDLSPGSPRFVLGWGGNDASGQPQPVVDQAAASAWRQRVAALKTAMDTATDLPEVVIRRKARRAEQEASEKAFAARWSSGAEAPDFTTYDLNGKAVRLSDYRGKVVILHFWCYWCGPCKAAIPRMQALARQYKRQGVVVLAAGTEDGREDFEKFVTGNLARYPDVIWTHDKAGRGDERASRALYDVSGTPTQFVIDRKGKVVQAVVGYSEGEVIVEGALAKAGI